MSEIFYVTTEPKSPPVHPGVLLREDFLPYLKISVSEFARKLGISRQMLHGILAESRSITPEMALRIGKFLGNGPKLWINLQVDYDLWHARNNLKEALDSIPTIPQLPLDEDCDDALN